MIEKFIISLTKKSETKLDKLILENCPPSLSLSRTKIQDLIKRQMVFDPQKNDALTSKTKTNDLEQVILYVDKELQKNLIPEDLEVPIVFEDKSLVVFNKPANMVVHPVKSSQRGTLVNFLVYRYTHKNFLIEIKEYTEYDEFFRYTNYIAINQNFKNINI